MATKTVYAGIVLKLVTGLSAGLLVLSFFQPAFYIGRKDYDAYADGKYLFFLGWMSALGGNTTATIIWLANPLYFITLILLFKRKSEAFPLSILATIIAFSISLLGSIMTDEAGNYSKITSLQAGYWLWVTSMAVLTLGLLANNVIKKNSS